MDGLDGGLGGVWYPLVRCGLAWEGGERSVCTVVKCPDEVVLISQDFREICTEEVLCGFYTT